jgi:hypothetical protein
VLFDQFFQGRRRVAFYPSGEIGVFAAHRRTRLLKAISIARSIASVLVADLGHCDLGPGRSRSV